MGPHTDEGTGTPSGPEGSGEERPGRSRRRRLLFPLTLTVLAVLAVFGLREVQYRLGHESTDDAYLTGHLVPVLARVGGFVEELPVAENDHVQAGERLVALDDAELREALRQRRAELEEARAAADHDGGPGGAVARVDEARSRVESLSARLEGARVRLRKARKDLERIQGLAEKAIVPRQQLDAAEADVATAEAEVTALENERGAAQAAIRSARAGVSAADARLEGARAAVEKAALELSYATISAPVAGTVARRGVEPGQLLQPGQPVMTIVADTGVVVTANFKETQMAELRTGQRVKIDVDAYGDCPAEGTVESIGGATGSQFSLLPPENATGNFTKVVQRVPVRIRIDRACGDGRPLRPGLSVVVHVTTG